MSESPASLSRRQALKLFGGMPLLPLGAGIGTSALLTACGGGSTAATAATPTAAVFTGMAAPSLSDPGAMATTSVASSLQVSYSDGSKQTYKLGYQQLFMTGDQVPNQQGGTILAGGYFDINGNPIIDKSVAGQERQFFSDCPDGMSLLQPIAGADKTKLGVKGNPVFAVVQYEYTTKDLGKNNQYGKLPSPIAVLTLDQDPATGKLSLVKYYNVP
ncbi:MAG: alkaline phosphatase, partial [Thiomonas sp.]